MKDEKYHELMEPLIDNLISISREYGYPIVIAVQTTVDEENVAKVFCNSYEPPNTGIPLITTAAILRGESRLVFNSEGECLIVDNTFNDFLKDEDAFFPPAHRKNLVQ